MVKNIELEPEQIGQLKCINLHGINPDKLNTARTNFANGETRVIDLVDDGEGDYCLLDGHHGAVVARENNSRILARVWSEGENPDKPLVKVNIQRWRRFNSTAESLGLGRIDDLVAKKMGS